MAEERSLLYLPEALEENILVRLPVKSIFRFESVCKRWYSLFRSKAFKELYSGSSYHQVLIPTKKDLRLIYPELRLRGRRRRRGRRSVTSAIGPLSNGIYALISVLMNTQNQNLFPHTLRVALFNPAARRLKFAAPFPAEYLSRLTGIYSHESFVSCGIDDDYRVVVLIKYDGRRHMHNQLCFLVFLYTWRTGEWEKLIDCYPGQHQTGLPPGADVFECIVNLLKEMTACPHKLLNGCWHWLTHQQDVEGGDLENSFLRFMVLFFDFERKSFGLIHGPPCKATFYADVFVLQDHLAAIVNPEFDLQPLVQIWMKMKDPETIWTNIYSVNPSSFEAGHFVFSIFYGVDYYQVQEPELIRIKSVTLLIHLHRLVRGKLVTFDDKGGHQVAEEEEDSDQIPLSLAGISTFRPTIERLPDSTQCTVDYAKSLLELKSDSIVKSFEQIHEIPFAFQHAIFLVNKSELVLASMASFEAGFSHNLFVKWATNKKILILFSERGLLGAVSPTVVKALIASIIREEESTAAHTAMAVESHETEGLSVGGHRYGGAYSVAHMFPFCDSSAVWDVYITEYGVSRKIIWINHLCRYT